MNPKNKQHLGRLRDAMRFSRKKLEPFRRRQKEAIEQYVGIDYSDGGSDKPVLLNLMEIAANIYERQLAARPPKVLVFTHSRKLRSHGVKLEQAMNSMLRTYDVHNALRRCVRSSLFSMGICKVGTQVIGNYEEEGFSFTKTRPYVASVSLDDWVHDMTSHVPEEIDYCGHRYRMSLESAKKDKSFNKSARENLTSMEDFSFNESGDERTSTITQGASQHEGQLEDKIELWEIWLPKERLIVTLGPNEGDKPLKVVEWDGPPNPLGPYHLLYFNEVDGNSMPLAPAMLWRGLHEVSNGLFRKLVREAQRFKVIGLTRGVDSEDADRIRMASDGEIVGVDNPEAIQEKMFGGIDQRNFAFMLQIKQLFSWQAGNLDLMGGLGAQSETATQDQLLHASASQRMSGMQDEVRLFTKKVIRDWGFHLWSDPVESYPVRLNEQPVGPVETFLTPEERATHDFLLHEVDIEPYSMQFVSPQERLAKLNQIIGQVVLPSLPMMQQQGLGIDYKELLNTFSRYSDLPELKDIIVGLEDVPPGSDQMGPSGGGAPGMPASTHRVNERISRPGASPRGAEQTLVNTMMGGNPQQAEQGAMAREMMG
jgi:hypothetical protein